MITAKEAKALSGPTMEDYLKEIEPKIKASAEKGGREVLIRSEPYARWLYNEQSLTGAQKQTVEKLRELGYELSLYYKELQFVDMGLIIKW